MNADARADSWFNVGVAIWWTAQFMLCRRFEWHDAAPEYRSESTRRLFMRAFRTAADRARIEISGVTQ